MPRELLTLGKLEAEHLSSNLGYFIYRKIMPYLFASVSFSERQQ